MRKLKRFIKMVLNYSVKRKRIFKRKLTEKEKENEYEIVNKIYDELAGYSENDEIQKWDATQMIRKCLDELDDISLPF